jgi:RND family efflux transporter MFP subunit
MRLFILPAMVWSLLINLAYAGVEKVTTEAYDSQVVLGGTVVPYREVVLTAQVAGRVNFLAGVEGDGFNANELLVLIDDADLQAQRRALIAQFNKAQAALVNAQTEYQRELWNPQSRSISKMPGFAVPSMIDQTFSRPIGKAFGFEDDQITRQADLYNRNSIIQQATADVMQAQATIEALDAKVRDARGQAPFQGIIIKKMVEVGDTVLPGQKLLQYAQSSHLSIEVNIPLRLMGKLVRGDIVSARLDKIGETKARVSQIYPVADVQQHTIKVKFDLPLGVSAGPGMYAEVFLPNAVNAQESMPVISKNALVKRGSLPSVYVVNAQNIVELRLIRLGRELPNEKVFVLSGLKVGESIITSPPKAIASGWVVRGDEVIPR